MQILMVNKFLYPHGGAAELTDPAFQIKDTTEQALEAAIASVKDSPSVLLHMSEDSAARALHYTDLPEYCRQLIKIYQSVITR